MPSERNENGLLKKAVELGWIYPLQHTPLFVFRPKLTQLVTVLRDILIDAVAVHNGFEEYIFPRIVPEEVLAKTGWLTYHREEAWLVDPKREFTFNNPDEDGLFPKQTRFPEQPHPYALDPIQCVSLYYALHGNSIPASELPLKAFEFQGGWTHRYESAPSGLLRGIEFLRLELVWIAKEKDAVDIRNSIVEATMQAITDQIHLHVQAAKGDSCFVEPPPQENGYGQIYELADLMHLFPQPSIDILCKYQGADLEIASAGRDLTLPRRFQISLTGQPNVNLWSGCLGIGLTRLAAAFLDHWGFDLDKWPESRMQRALRNVK